MKNISEGLSGDFSRAQKRPEVLFSFWVILREENCRGLMRNIVRCPKENRSSGEGHSATSRIELYRSNKRLSAPFLWPFSKSFKIIDSGSAKCPLNHTKSFLKRLLSLAQSPGRRSVSIPNDSVLMISHSSVFIASYRLVASVLLHLLGPHRRLPTLRCVKFIAHTH